MRIENVKPISQIQEEQQLIDAEKARIVQLETDKTNMENQITTMQETINFLLGL